MFFTMIVQTFVELQWLMCRHIAICLKLLLYYRSLDKNNILNLNIIKLIFYNGEMQTNSLTYYSVRYTCSFYTHLYVFP